MSLSHNAARLRACALSLIVLVGSYSLQAAETATASLQSRIAIDNFGQIGPTYFRGAQPKGADYARLAAAGIRTVIDLQADFDPSEDAMVKSAGMAFHRIPMTTRVPPTAEQQALFLKLVNDPANQPVYVHCAGGRHRTGVMTALYRMAVDHWNAEKAFQEMKQYKFGAIFLHPEFKRFVYAYQPDPAPSTLPTVIAVGTPGAGQ